MTSPQRRTLPVDCQRCEKRGNGMFCNFASDTLADFSAIGRLISLPAGAVLMREDDPCEQVYLICSGQIKLSCTSKEGKTHNMKIAGAGEVLGLGAVVSDRLFEATAESLTPCMVKVIRKDEFLTFIHAHGEAGWSTARSLAEEYRSAFSGVRNLALSGSVAGRIAKLLLDLAQSESTSPQPMRFNLSLTHDDLAEFTCTSRESVTRTLGKFQRDNLISVRGAVVQILQPDKLWELCA